MSDSGEEINKELNKGIDSFDPGYGSGSSDLSGKRVDASSIVGAPEFLSDDPSSSVRGGIITARGTVDGLVIRLDARVERIALKQAIEEFLDARKAFLSGQEVSLEWVGARPDELFVSELSGLLQEKFSIGVRSSKLKESSRVFPAGGLPQTKGGSSLASTSDTGRSKSLFDGMEVLSDSKQDSMKGSRGESLSRGSGYREGGVREESFWDDADARIIYTTLRSGQKIETDHSLVVFGDVNSGAEIVAGGDIIVLGTLRGVAHAGAYDETGGGRAVFALNLQATQLRIGMVISRGSADSPQKGPELARVEGGLIVVEPYSVKNLGNRSR